MTKKNDRSNRQDTFQETLKSLRTISRVVVALIALLLAGRANAVVVRGYLTDAYGKPLAGGQVRLVEAGTVVAHGNVAADGAFEVRSVEVGRFTLLGLARGYLPGVSGDFYAGEFDVLDRNVVLATDSVLQEPSANETGIPTPLPQLSEPVGVVSPDALATEVGVTGALRQPPGVFLVQSGQMGGTASLYLRGGSATANLVTVDGAPASDVGGTFDFGTVSATGVGKIDVVRGADSAMHGTGAGAGVVALETPHGFTQAPVLTYSGEAGSLYTYRNEITAAGTLSKLDFFGGISRLDTSNALPQDEFHVETEALNLGYSFNGNTHLRGTLRNSTDAVGEPGAWDFQGIADDAKQGDHDLYAAMTVDNLYKGDWHNLVRYAIARKDQQEQQFGHQGTPITFFGGTAQAYTAYFGNVVTIRGANGYKAVGQTEVSGETSQQDSNRDQLYYQSDYTVSRHFIGLFGFRFDDERGLFNEAAIAKQELTHRTNFEYNLQFQGEFFDRLFYSAGGALEKNHLYGIAGTPRLGLVYVPVWPRGSGFHGTRLRANAATGVQEPTLAIEALGLYQQLLAAGDTADVVKYRVGPQTAECSRSYDLGLDQNIAGDKLVLKAGYFHNVFDHQLEPVSSATLARDFGLGLAAGSGVVAAFLNSLAYRAQGAEVELLVEAGRRYTLRGGYTYLDTRVVQSFASDAVAAAQGTPTENPNLAGIAIGAEGPLVGARPFRRPPHTGYFDLQRAGKKLTWELRGALAGRSDDSTFLGGLDTHQASTLPNAASTLLLPNRDLDFGYVRLDLGFTYALSPALTFFARGDNLLNDQHIGPIGYPGLPLTFRTGLMLRLGGG
jgi:iron complex outermembrane receptor protein/vitamin B12 transporter